MRIAAAKAQALPSIIAERFAKNRKASLATQKKSRDSSRGLAFSFCVFIVLVLLWAPPQAKTALIRADKELWSCTPGSLCQHVDALTTEYKTEHETDS